MHPSSLERPLQRFCLGAFALLARELEAGDELEFAFEEHRSPGRPALYDYRPLARSFVERRGGAIAQLDDARIALDELRRLPQAALFARAHSESGLSPDEALVRTILLPLVTKTVERCGGFDWDDRVWERVVAELEGTLFAKRRAYAAIAPLVGISAGAPVELAAGLRIRGDEPGELASHWPEAAGLFPPGWGREPDMLLVLEWECPLDAVEAEPPDAPAELADAVTAVRLATGGPVAAGPVLFERLDWRPFGIRPLLPVAAARPEGDPVRLDVVRGRVARDLLARLWGMDAERGLDEAVERWELSLFQAAGHRHESLREALVGVLGGGDGPFAAVLRAALLLGDSGNERRELLGGLRGLAKGAEAGPAAVDSVRRALVEVLLHGDRAALIESLDDSLLGLQPRPSVAAAARAAAG